SSSPLPKATKINPIPSQFFHFQPPTSNLLPPVIHNTIQTILHKQHYTNNTTTSKIHSSTHSITQSYSLIILYPKPQTPNLNHQSSTPTMHIPSILKFSLLISTSLCIAAPTAVTTPTDAVIEYTRASQDPHSLINLMELGELGEKRDGFVDLVRVSEGNDGFGDGLRFFSKRDGSLEFIQLDSAINLVQLPEKKRQVSPIDLVQLSNRAAPINLFQLSEKRQDSPVNLVELGNRQTQKHKYNSMRPRNAQDASINLVELGNRQVSPIKLIELSNRARAKYLKTRQNDCGSSPYQNPSCSAATGLGVPAFTLLAVGMVAIMMV
ncbi:71cadab5-d599-4254-b015-3a92f89856cb, partial [Sclerotinia trifoliorum]